MGKRPNYEKSALKHNVSAVFYFIIEKMMQELPSRIFIKMDSMGSFIKTNAKFKCTELQLQYKD